MFYSQMLQCVQASRWEKKGGGEKIIDDIIVDKIFKKSFSSAANVI